MEVIMKKKIIWIVLGVILMLCLLGAGVYYLYQYTEVFGKKVIPVKMDSVVVRYVPGYDFDDVNKLNTGEKEVVPIQEVSLTKKEIKEIQSILRGTSSIDSSKKEISNYKYEIVINKKTTIYVQQKKGFVTTDNKTNTIIIPNRLHTTIDFILQKNNKKVLKTPEFQDVVLKLEGSSITVKNKDNLKYIKDYISYYPISMDGDYKIYNNGYKAEVILDGKTHIYFYSSKIGYIQENDAKTFVIFSEDLYDLIHQIYEKSIEE